MFSKTALMVVFSVIVSSHLSAVQIYNLNEEKSVSDSWPKVLYNYYLVKAGKDMEAGYVGHQYHRINSKDYRTYLLTEDGMWIWNIVVIAENELSRKIKEGPDGVSARPYGMNKIFEVVMDTNDKGQLEVKVKAVFEFKSISKIYFKGDLVLTSGVGPCGENGENTECIAIQKYAFKPEIMTKAGFYEDIGIDKGLSQSEKQPKIEEFMDTHEMKTKGTPLRHF